METLVQIIVTILIIGSLIGGYLFDKHNERKDKDKEN